MSISPCAVLVADSGGGGGGAMPQIVISPARADSDNTKSNTSAAHRFLTCFIGLSPEVGGWFVRYSEIVSDKPSPVGLRKAS